MRPSLLNNSKINGVAILSGLLFVLCAGAACRTNTESGTGNSAGIVVVNAPATGEVRRVLVGEGVKVTAGTPIIEIAVLNETATVAPTPGESAEARAARTLKSSGTEIEAARAEVTQHEAEVARLTPLVASGEVSPAQLDGERALYDRAQQRLQHAKDAERNAEGGLLAARQPGRNQGGITTSATPATAAPREQIVTARASSDGTVRVVNARVGEHVTSGQVLATLSAEH
jgi:multidrug efflux pump subunit AcrA (membrane-fusion protein)